MTWIILGLLGILMIAAQQTIKNAFYVVMAAGLILAGAAGVAAWWQEKPKSPGGLALLIAHIALCCIGIWIVLNPAAFDVMINLLIGLVLIVSGVQWLLRGLTIGDRVIAVLAVISVLLGVFVARTGAATGLPIVLGGASLIYTAAAGFVSEGRYD